MKRAIIAITLITATVALAFVILLTAGCDKRRPGDPRPLQSGQQDPAPRYTVIK